MNGGGFIASVFRDQGCLGLGYSEDVNPASGGSPQTWFLYHRVAIIALEDWKLVGWSVCSLFCGGSCPDGWVLALYPVCLYV